MMPHDTIITAAYNHDITHAIYKCDTFISKLFKYDRLIITIEDVQTYNFELRAGDRASGRGLRGSRGRPILGWLTWEPTRMKLF